MEHTFPDGVFPSAALSSIGVGVVAANAKGKVVFINRHAEKMTGWSASEAGNQNVEDLFRLVDDVGAAAGTLIERINDSIDSGSPRREEAILVRRDGQRFPVEYSVTNSCDESGRSRGVMIVFADISESRLMALHLARVANQDLLTGLLNRRAFMEQLAAALTRSRDVGETSTLLFLDLDQFKLVNDMCGHEVGDDLLLWVAALLRETVGERDAVARPSGDEFAVLLTRRDADEAFQFARYLQARMGEFSFSWGGRTFSTTACIGIAQLGGELRTPTQALSAADQACYMAKDKGRSGIQLFERHDAEVSQRVAEMQWVSQIDDKLRGGQAHLFAQPIRRLVTGPPQGLQCEVLLRFEDDDGAMRDPGQMIRAAERFGLMPAVDRWVIRNTLETLKGLEGDALRRIHLCFINLSGLSLRDDSVLDFIRGELAASAVPPHKLGFEITETSAVENLQQARWFIQELGSIGCRLSLDDFGTGVASYSYLKALPVEYLKIDGGFVESMTTSTIDRAMVESINQISHVLGMQTVAESVGSQELLNQVRSIGIDHAQGFWIAPPRPLADACHAA